MYYLCVNILLDVRQLLELFVKRLQLPVSDPIKIEHIIWLSVLKHCSYV